VNLGFAILLALLASQRLHVDVNAQNTTGVTAPSVLWYPDPYYTRAARENKIQGSVVIEGSFDADGKMTVVRTVKGLGYGLDESALAAIRGWKFSPACRNGVPVSGLAQVDIDFNLADAPAAEFDDVNWARGTTIPKVLQRVEPRYPAEAGDTRVSGTVVLQVVIQADGTPKIVKVVKPLGLGFTENAIEAIQQWKFQPAAENGRPVSVSVNVEINFALEQAVAPPPPRCPVR
jgi:TonB family protein